MTEPVSTSLSLRSDQTPLSACVASAGPILARSWSASSSQALAKAVIEVPCQCYPGPAQSPTTDRPGQPASQPSQPPTQARLLSPSNSKYRCTYPLVTRGTCTRYSHTLHRVQPSCASNLGAWRAARQQSQFRASCLRLLAFLCQLPAAACPRPPAGRRSSLSTIKSSFSWSIGPAPVAVCRFPDTLSLQY